MPKLYLFILSFFYVGYFKYAPGTIASMITAFFYFFIPSLYLIQLSIITVTMISGFYLCYIYNTQIKKDDPSFIVIDEVLGMSIALFMLPKSFIVYLLSFIIFRSLDIFKPFFISHIEKIDYGVGIMLDDLISGLLTLFFINIMLLYSLI